ncbi:integrin [Nitrospiraceae bacterium HYJII51-Mn-bac16s-1-B09]|uniref:Integrin n=2 Tax=Candidatus Manganitrophus noduliformans TaxID=2606439 RepID=A0A7X6DLH4_9BACT|nr:integrin [Candidatus Manganitrophus noduliformans]
MNWQSSGDAVATVSDTGLVSAVSPGTVVITAVHTETHLSGTIEMTVIPPGSFPLTVTFGIKQLQFDWPKIGDDTFYRLFENPDGVSGFSQIGGDIPAGTTAVTRDIVVYRHNWGKARYRLSACDQRGCIDSNEIDVLDGMLQTIGYFKSSNKGPSDDFGLSFGFSVALSGDGNTLAVGALNEASAATGINGNQADNSAADSGAVYLFARSGGNWSQQAYIKASNTDAGDGFGYSVALSADGNTLAVGARYEASAATGINGNQADNSANNAGAVYLFIRSGESWSQEAYIKSSNTNIGDEFGDSVALSGDGNTLAVGAPYEDSGGQDSGAVYLFFRNGSWTQQAYIKGSNTGASDKFGWSVALSTDGSALAVGAWGEASAATGINGNQADNSAQNAGAVYLFIRDGESWSQQAYIKPSITHGFNPFGGSEGGLFGYAVTLSGDGNTLAVGAYAEPSSATGINGNQADTSARQAGAVYLFVRSGGNWSQQAYIKASNTDAGDWFGFSVALGADGNTLAVGALNEASAAAGIHGNQTDNSADDSGAVYFFVRNGESWSQEAYIKASNTDAGDWFGHSVALSGDGATLAAGARFESSAATGIDGNQDDDAMMRIGAVYLY